jgi:hypothetical protein
MVEPKKKEKVSWKRCWYKYMLLLAVLNPPLLTTLEPVKFCFVVFYARRRT